MHQALDLGTPLEHGDHHDVGDADTADDERNRAEPEEQRSEGIVGGLAGFERVGRLIERNIIEIAPLAFMRGRTLNESFVILDEAQNTTIEQMKMFLTRTGFNSHAVVTGDVTQIDLPSGQRSGLKHATQVLDDVEGVAFTYFQPRDVVRHQLVQRIVEAYEADEADG